MPVPLIRFDALPLNQLSLHNHTFWSSYTLLLTFTTLWANPADDKRMFSLLLLLLLFFFVVVVFVFFFRK